MSGTRPRPLEAPRRALASLLIALLLAQAVGVLATSHGWPDPADAPLRPGVRIADSSCTANFVFRSLDNATLYLGTAAHCVDDEEEFHVGGPVPIDDGRLNGTLVYVSFHTMEEVGETDEAALDGNDFALVAIPDAHRHEVHPAVRHWGGPTGTAAPAGGDHAITFGNSRLRNGTGLQDAREGYVMEVTNWTTEVLLAPGSVPGDSGSAVMVGSGGAIGTLVTLSGSGSFSSDDGLYVCPLCNGVTNLEPALAYASTHANVTVELVTWPLSQDPELPPYPLMG